MSKSAADLQGLFRNEVADSATPYLWSSDDFYTYLDDGLRMFYRLTEGIEDSRTPVDADGTPVTLISVVPGTEWYPISKLLLKIRTAYRTDNGTPISVRFPERLGDLGIYFDGRKGPVDSIIQGLDKHALRIWPVPNETMTIQLTTFRLPLVSITADTEDSIPEIDDQHALSILLWVKHRAYDKQDTETYDKNKAADFKARFEAYCLQAKREQIRARHIAGAVAYGGIPIRGQQLSSSRSNDYFNR